MPTAYMCPHYCGELSAALVDRTLTLCRCATRRRGPRNASAPRDTGRGRRRPQGTVNPALRSGEVEVLAHELEILNPSAPLPFQLADDNLNENTRLAHRIIDLRREPMQ